MNQGEFAEAQLRFENAVKQDPGDYPARYYLGEVYSQQGKFREAEEQFEEALRLKPSSQSARYEMGLIAEREERWDRAFSLYREVLEKAPGRPEAAAASNRIRLFGETPQLFRASHEHLAAANRLMAQGKTEEARVEFETVVRLSPRNEPALGSLAEIYQASNRLPEAIADLEQIVRFNPNNLGALYKLATLYEAQEDFDRAIPAYKQLVQAGREGPEAESARMKLSILGENPEAARQGARLYEQGRAQITAGKLDEALATFQKMLTILPGNSQAHMSVAEIYLRQGKEDDAISEYKKIHAVEPNHFPSHYALGVLYWDRGLLEEARDELQIVARYSRLENLTRKAELLLPAIQADIASSKIAAEARKHQSRAVELSRQGKFPEAIDEMQQAIRLVPKNPYYHYNLGIIYANNGQFDQSYFEFKSAVDLKPDHVASHFRLGLFYQLSHLFPYAMGEFEKTIALGKAGDFEVEEAKTRLADLRGEVREEQVGLGHSILGQELFSRKEYDLARYEFETAVEVDPYSGANHYNLGLLEKIEGNTDFAEADFNDATQVDPTYTPAYYQLAGISLYKGEFDQAIEMYNHVLVEEPDNTNAHFQLGGLLEKEGYFLPALEQYHLVIDEDPENKTGNLTFANARVAFFEKHWSLSMTYNLITYISNIAASANPEADYSIGFGATFTYWTHRTPTLSVPIVFSTSNSEYVLSQIQLSTNAIGPQVGISITDNLILTLIYKLIYQQTQVGPGSLNQQPEATLNWTVPALTWNPGQKHSWVEFLPDSYSFDAFYQHTYSYQSALLDADRELGSITLSKWLSNYGTLTFSYTYLNSDVVDPSQSLTNQTITYTYLNTFYDKFHIIVGYSSSRQDFKSVDAFFHEKRSIVANSPSVGISYDMRPNIHFTASFTDTSSSSNLEAASSNVTSTGLLEFLSGQSAALGSYHNTLISTGISFEF